jgi:hypothetical protein
MRFKHQISYNIGKNVKYLLHGTKLFLHDKDFLGRTESKVYISVIEAPEVAGKSPAEQTEAATPVFF